MKRIKLFFSVFVALFFICNEMYAQQMNEVTLVVSADGATKDEATKIALRSAIEQTYGAFVSSNTTILNDELVKDEIVTISNGNIKEYKELVSKQMPNGRLYVTLQATVSVAKLISYAKSKGAETEFAGATFGMNIKMKELNKQNEKKVLDNMLSQLHSLPNLFDYEMQLEEPKMNGDMCEVKGEIYIMYNGNTQLYNEIIFKTLSSLSLTKEEREDYKKMGIKYYPILLPYSYGGSNARRGVFAGRKNDYFYFALRNDFDKELINIRNYARNFDIADNITSPTKLKIINDYNLQDLKEDIDGNIFDISPYTYYAPKYVKVKKQKHFGNWVQPRSSSDVALSQICPEDRELGELAEHRKLGDKIWTLPIIIKIPANEIGKYSSFKVEPRK